jgi:hypothetical protein
VKEEALLAFEGPVPEYTGPVLDITDDGSLLALADLTIWTVMVYPQDANARDEFLVAVYADMLADLLDKGFVSNDRGEVVKAQLMFDEFILKHGGFATLAQAPNVHEGLLRARERFFPGVLAGSILLRTIQLAVSDLSYSVNKAVDLMIRSLNEINDGKKRGSCSERTLWDAWMDYKSVAHLWAAYLTEDPNLEQSTLLIPLQGIKLSRFFAGVGYFHQIGTQLCAKGQVKPVLDPSETWRCPPDLRVSSKLSLSISRLDDSLVEIAKQYRAPKRF